MPRTHSKTHGFSLLELMIAIAIVGILTSLAIPAYQDYTIRAKVSEALQIAASAKFAVSEYYVSNGDLPSNMTQAGISDTATNYVSAVNYVKPENENSGQIVLTMSNRVGADANGKKLVLEASIDSHVLKWKCRTAETDGLNVKYLPASCR